MVGVSMELGTRPVVAAANFEVSPYAYSAHNPTHFL
jgi:hypothetical protein